MIKTYLDLSTGHLDDGALAFLHHSGMQNYSIQGPAMLVLAYDGGYVVTVPPVALLDTAADMTKLPGSLAVILHHAATLGAEMVRFDTDGDLDPNLHYYPEL